MRADCSTGGQRNARGERTPKALRRRPLPAPMREQLLFPNMEPAPRAASRQQVELPLGPKPKKKRKKPIDWEKCKCPSTSEVRVNAKGVRYCWGKTPGGGHAFVTPLCPEK